MIFRRFGHRVIAVVGLVVGAGLLGLGFAYAVYEEEAILRQNERAVAKVTDSVIQGLQTVMLAGYADIAEVFAARLKNVPDVVDFRILRIDGNEAFKDNQMIEEVNERKGEEAFYPRDNETVVSVLPSDLPELRKVIDEKRTVSLYEKDAQGVPLLTFLAPIKTSQRCYRCHGRQVEVRGVLKFTTTLEGVRKEIKESWLRTVVVLLIVTTVIMVLTGLLLRRNVIHPVIKVSDAMRRVAGGQMDQGVPVPGRDEVGNMAHSFNEMTRTLKDSHSKLQTEQDKLSTVILSTQEGIVSTDRKGRVVLVNPAAEFLLGRSAEEIIQVGFENLLDNPEQMATWLARNEAEQQPETVEYKGRILSVNAATIRDEQGSTIGSAALLRDVTEETRLENELRRQSTTDPLTGLFNRRFLDHTLESELSRARRYRLSLSILMFDVDHFKKFNDTYGHDQGDRVLQFVAEAMRECTREVDVPCRYGGEEFLIILPNTDLLGAAVVGERLRSHIETMRVDGLQVTISIGVANYPNLDVEAGPTMIEMADAALYAAKEGGRNGVFIAGDKPIRASDLLASAAGGTL